MDGREPPAAAATVGSSWWREPVRREPILRREPVLIDQIQGRWRFGYVLAGFWLIYLAEPVSAAWRGSDRLLAVVTTLAVVSLAILYLQTWASVRRMRLAGRTTRERWRVIRLVAALVLGVVPWVTAGQHGLATTPYMIVLIMVLLPTRFALPVVIALGLVVVGLSEVVPSWRLNAGLVLSLLLTTVVMWAVTQMIARNVQLRQQAELAVAHERARFARDLHDVLGHSLTLLAMKAELAGRLVQLDPDRAETEIADVERLARDALADVRTAVGGYRGTSLVTELIAARAALDAAGIEAELPVAVDDVPGERRELFGWVVREGVTNVVRHSAARRCRIVVDHDRVEVLDDGRGPGTEAERCGVGGHGLAGLRERAVAAGAALTVGRSSDGGFRLSVGW